MVISAQSWKNNNTVNSEHFISFYFETATRNYRVALSLPSTWVLKKKIMSISEYYF